jgi:hypothetical protein
LIIFPLEIFFNSVSYLNICQMDIDSNNQNEQTTLLNVLIYAVDEQGIRENSFTTFVFEIIYRNLPSIRN